MASAPVSLLRPVAVAALCSLACPAYAQPEPRKECLIEDFEAGYTPARWQFSNGPEFPGAHGALSRSAESAHSGQWGGRLTFDFSAGGNYVAAILRLPEAGPAASNIWTGLRVWLKRPEGNDVTFRCADEAGQTLQKTVECPAGRWVELSIPFGGWTGHWGGPNDGAVHGRPQSLALVLEHGAQTKGALLFDDLRLADTSDATARARYAAYQFEPSEGWHAYADGPGGATRLEGKTWTVDFPQGARWVSLGVPDHVLPGNVDKLRLRLNARGAAQGRPVRFLLHTHFMDFRKKVGVLTGEGEQELVTEGPPGPGWEWFGGENDGKLHGPLRLGEISVGAAAAPGACSLELRELSVEASCPQEKRCLLTAVAAPGEPAAFHLRARALADAPMSGALRWIWRDWEGRTLGRGERPVVLPAKAEPLDTTIQPSGVDFTGLNFVEAECLLDVPGQETAPVRPAWVRGLMHQNAPALAPDSPFGMGVYLDRYGGDPAGLAQMERAAEAARDAGVKYSRESFTWDRIEPARGRFDWAYYDRLVDAARRNGITVYAIASEWSSWTKPYTAEGIEDYTRFLQALVRRYQKDIREWEIWNEPNIFFWQGPKDLYAELLAKSYAAVKQVDPGARVLGLSTAGIDHDFIARMASLGAPYDVLTIHPYRAQLDDLGFIRDLQRVSDEVRTGGGANRPVWLTEMGWATHTPHNTLRQDFVPNSLHTQAELIARSYLCSIVSGVEPKTFWYDFRDDGDDPVYFEHTMGIVYRDFRPKPACIAFATLARVLEGRRLAGPVDCPEGILAYSFKPAAGGDETLALWSPHGDTRLDVPMHARRVLRINAMGEQEELPVAAGRVTVELRRGAPVYLAPRPE